MADRTRGGLAWMAAGLALLLGGGAAWAATGPVVIVKPLADETIHDNSGHLDVTVNVGSGQGLAPGERLRLLIDGKRTGRDRRSLAMGLDGVVRGSHSLQALVVDRSGRPVARSDPVTFHMWQASRLFPNRRK